MLSFLVLREWPHGYKILFLLNSTEHKILAAHKNLNSEKIMRFSFAFQLSDVVFIMLIKSKNMLVS